MEKLSCFNCDIVSLERSIFKGNVKLLVVVGEVGELGIYYNHAPLITRILPGPAKIIKEDGVQEIFYISGGFLEVQPDSVIILADTILRAKDISEAAVKKAQIEAKKILKNKISEIDYSKALIKLAETTAQLKTIQALRKKT